MSLNPRVPSIAFFRYWQSICDLSRKVTFMYFYKLLYCKLTLVTYPQILVTFYSLIHSFISNISNISSFHLSLSDHTSPVLPIKIRWKAGASLMCAPFGLLCDMQCLHCLWLPNEGPVMFIISRTQ